jgi:hypothetical protein
MRTRWVFILAVLGLLSGMPALAGQVRFRKIAADNNGKEPS